jgi:hypothetical protein
MKQAHEELVKAEIVSHSDALQFITGGRAVFTLRSRKTETRYTYRVVEKDEGKVWFVMYLVAPDQYEYLGAIFGKEFKLTKKSKLTYESTPVKAFKWTFDMLQSGQMPRDLEFFHEGRCCVCARPLTVPESIQRGIGPDCYQKYFCN